MSPYSLPLLLSILLNRGRMKANGISPYNLPLLLSILLIAVLKLMESVTGEASQDRNPRFIAEIVKGDAVAPTRSLITLI